MMNRFCHLLIVALLPCWAFAQQDPLDPPVFTGSFKAMGELVQNVKDVGTFQVRFEEHFDAATQNAEFTVWQGGEFKTFLEIGKANQTLLYENDATCRAITKKEYIQVKAPPSFMGYSDDNGKIQFSVKHLLDIDKKLLKQRRLPRVYRGVPALLWTYEMRGVKEHIGTIITIYAYWSDPSWNTTSGSEQVPLGFELTNITTTSTTPITTAQYVSVFAFLKGVVDENAFKPREGIYCENRAPTYKLPLFPLVESLSLRSEYVVPLTKDIRSMDAWYDTTNGFLRVDISEVDSFVADEQPPVKYISQVTSKELGVTFRMQTEQERGWYCGIIPIDQYRFETEEIINPKLDLKQWSIHSIIGENTANYVFIGNTHKRNIPCKMYQGLRKDWPHATANVTTLWEWCFAFMIESLDEDIYLRDGEIGLIYASIKIIQADSSFLPIGFRMVHHFYDVVNENPGNMSLSTFDVDKCFRQENEKKFLEFSVNANINKDNVHIYENATSNLDFLATWKTAIASAAGVSLKTMRIASVQSFVHNYKLYMNFVLLELHEDLPTDAKKGQPTLSNAISTLKKKINAGALYVSYKLSPKDKKPTNLTASKNSLVDNFGKTEYIPLTSTSTASTQTTRATLPTFSLIGDDTTSSSPVSKDGSTVTGTGTGTRPTIEVTSGKTVTGPTPSVPPDDKAERLVYEGHKPGTVAGVSIVMLLLGVTFGAGGTFYSFKGLPSFLRFR